MTELLKLTSPKGDVIGTDSIPRCLWERGKNEIPRLRHTNKSVWNIDEGHIMDVCVIHPGRHTIFEVGDIAITIATAGKHEDEIIHAKATIFENKG